MKKKTKSKLLEKKIKHAKKINKKPKKENKISVKYVDGKKSSLVTPQKSVIINNWISTSIKLPDVVKPIVEKPISKEQFKNDSVKEEALIKEEEVETDSGDTSKRRRRGRNKKEKIYFSKKTEESIIEYNNETCMAKRNYIYEEKIKFSFEKLVENIFNTFKFTYFDNSPIEIQKETVCHLVTNIHKFQAGKGKAFSYFSIVAKNYLIFHNNSNYKRFNQHVDISETPGEDSVCLQTEDKYHKNIQSEEYMKLLINYWEKNVTKLFSKQKDLNIAYAVIELFRTCHRIENFNKKTLYLYIRELSNSRTQQITKVINKMKCYQSVLEENYNNSGLI